MATQESAHGGIQPIAGNHYDRCVFGIVCFTHDPTVYMPSGRSCAAPEAEDALDGKRTLAIRYSDGEGRETELRVDPQLLGGTFGHWYLVAYCHVRESIRWFRLDRITAAHLTAQASTDRPVSDIGVPPDTARSV